MAKRTVGGIYVITDPTKTFADEYGVRDLVLSPSESRRVKQAAEAVGLPLGHAPTGRTVSLILQHCMNVALQKSTELSRKGHHQRAGRWFAEYLRAKAALGKNVN